MVALNLQVNAALHACYTRPIAQAWPSNMRVDGQVSMLLDLATRHQARFPGFAGGSAASTVLQAHF